MSIDYVTEQPMTLAEAVNVLKALDCTIDQPDNRSVVARDPDGNYFHLTDDIGCYNSLCINVSANEMTVYPTEVHDGTMREPSDPCGFDPIPREHLAFRHGEFLP
jgi:hypothetical protein